MKILCVVPSGGFISYHLKLVLNTLSATKHSSAFVAGMVLDLVKVKTGIQKAFELGEGCSKRSENHKISWNYQQKMML